MTQYKNIPQPQSQRNVQPELLGNFQYLCTPLGTTLNRNGLINVDHKASGDNESNPEDGFHSQISFVNQSQQLAPLPANPVNGQTADSALMPYFDGAGVSQLGFVTSAVNIQLTSLLNPILGKNGVSFLPSVIGGNSLILQWGTVDTVIPITSVTFNTPFSTAPYLIIVHPLSNQLYVAPPPYIPTGSETNTGFTIGAITLSTTFQSLYWFAIGPK